MNHTVLRRDEVLARLGIKKTAFHKLEGDGLIPPPFSMTGRRSWSYLESEINRVICARITGASDEKVRRLVARIVTDRAQFAEAPQ